MLELRTIHISRPSRLRAGATKRAALKIQKIPKLNFFSAFLTQKRHFPKSRCAKK
jgi:hypothetical protein